MPKPDYTTCCGTGRRACHNSVVVPASIVSDLPLVLGLEPKDLAMPALTFVVSAITLGTGRTYMMQDAVHLVLFGCCS